MTRIALRVASLGLAVLILAGILSVFAAANQVPQTAVEEIVLPITVNDLKPSDCAGLTLADIVIWHDGMGRDRDASLILGGPGADHIFGGKGRDCILGGGGDDVIDGDQGKDVCIGGPGNDTFVQCEEEVP